jgi:hypothetical protein
VAQIPPSFDIGSLTAQVAGDLDGDQVQDLLVTAMANATTGGMSGAGARAEGSGQGAAAGEGQAPTATVAVVSGASGDTLWSNSTSPGAPDRLDFQGDVAPASARESEPGKNGIPSPALPGIVAAVALAGLLARRRRFE